MVDQALPWLIWARKEIGQRELPENRGPVIRRYIELAHCGTEGEPVMLLLRRRPPAPAHRPLSPATTLILSSIPPVARRQ
jgi:hypothetical protein